MHRAKGDRLVHASVLSVWDNGADPVRIGETLACVQDTSFMN